MTRTRRTVAGALAAVALVTGAAAQGAAASGDEITLTYFTFSAAPDHLEDLDIIIEAFELDNPEIQIEVQTAAFADYFTSLQTQIAGGSAPDTFELNYENFVTYARSDVLLDLTPYLDGAIIDQDRYYELALNGFVEDDVQYGLPATFSNVVLIYNRAQFDEAGLDYPTADWTWDDYMTAAEALTDTEAGIYGGFQPVSFFEFYKALAQAGGEFFDAEGNAAFNSPEGAAAAEWLTSKPGTVMPTLAEIGGTPDFDSALFTSGKLAMWHNSIWQFNALNESGVDYDIVVEPGDVEEASAVFMNAAVISAGTDHPEAAARWVSFLTASPTTVEQRLASSWELPAVNDRRALGAYLEISPPDNRDAVFESLEHIVLPPVIERQQEMQDVVTQALERIVNDGVDIQEALDDAAAEVDSLSE